MPGYIAIASPVWSDYIQSKELQYAVYWCRKKYFRALSKGEPFYFLGNRLPNGDRILIGKSVFVGFSAIEVGEAWDRYGNSLGCASFEDFQNSIKAIYRNDSLDLGCIELEKPIFAKKVVKLSNCGIVFSPYTVSGKTISDDECRQIDKLLLEGTGE